MLTVVDATQNTYAIDTDASIEVENFKAIVEADTNVPADHQVLRHLNQTLEEGQRTLASYGVQNGDLILLSDARQRREAPTGAEADMSMAESARGQILASEQVQANLRRVRAVF